ncbi:MAG: hypothetical protein M1834_005540 [Cirrosporium novae-zelandiae]|nr:MAG: hypothetical protein M1834_005540 [Cirrosporium novae-zelandiae]
MSMTNPSSSAAAASRSSMITAAASQNLRRSVQAALDVHHLTSSLEVVVIQQLAQFLPHFPAIIRLPSLSSVCLTAFHLIHLFHLFHRLRLVAKCNYKDKKFTWPGSQMPKCLDA